MTLGFVRARYALALRAMPAFPGSRAALRGVSVVLTLQSLCSVWLCVAVYFRWTSTAGPAKTGLRTPSAAFEYHTVEPQPALFTEHYPGVVCFAYGFVCGFPASFLMIPGR